MGWRTKARIQKLCAVAPGGPSVYRHIQRRFGNLTSDPFATLSKQVELLRNLQDLGASIEGGRCLEVGTGHVPVAPFGFYLSGAAETVTVDIHTRLDDALTRAMLKDAVSSTDKVAALYDGLVPPAQIEARLEAIRPVADNPGRALAQAGIRYIAPGDASRMVRENDGSFDVSFSISTLEHISEATLVNVLREARRLLAPHGVTAHIIDPSDHFQHSDAAILPINFLRFTDSTWSRIGGNQFSYCNRLRASDMSRLFAAANLEIRRAIPTVDAASVDALENGFPLDPRFASYERTDLAVTRLDLYASAAPAGR